MLVRSTWLATATAMALLLLPATPVRADTIIHAASCANEDVLAALTSVSADDTTVMIPAGSCTWTAPLNYTQTYSMTIAGAGAISTDGGTDQTIILDGIPGNTIELGIVTAAGKSFRMTGIDFAMAPTNTTGDPAYNGIVGISGRTQELRIDHDHFDQLRLVDLNISGWIYGVVDHNIFDELYGDTNGVRVSHGAWNADALGNGDQSWADSEHYGTNQFVFIEDNTFNWLGAQSSGSEYAAVNDCQVGGRFVFRHNTMNGFLFVQTHEMASDYRGCRAFEVYDNVADTTKDSAGAAASNFDAFVATRMGTGLMWGNTLTGYAGGAAMQSDRTNTGHAFSPPPADWGYAGTTLGPSAWDGNTDATGYPLVDQVGRGKGDLLTGLFPDKVNSTTGTISWPNEELVPVYVWDNSFAPLPGEAPVYAGGDAPRSWKIATTT